MNENRKFRILELLNIVDILHVKIILWLCVCVCENYKVLLSPRPFQIAIWNACRT